MQKRERDTSYPSYKIVIIYILETLKIFHHLSNKYRALSGLVKKKKLVPYKNKCIYNAKRFYNRHYLNV